MSPEGEARIRAALAALGDALVAELEREQPQPTERLLSINEAAAQLGVGRTRLYREVGAGRLRTIKVGRRRLVPASALGTYLEAPW